MTDAVRSFAEGLKSVRASRRFLTETLEAWAVDGYDFGGPLVVTELATNAALHAKPPYWVRLSFEAGVLRVEVHDTSAAEPRRRDYGLEATTGRGLNIVADLSEDWGFIATDAGKVVWAVVRADEEASLAALFDLDDELTCLTTAAPADGAVFDRSLADASHRMWAA